MSKAIRTLMKPICHTALLMCLLCAALIGCVKATPKQSDALQQTPYPVLATPAPGMLYFVEDGARLQSEPEASSKTIRTLKRGDAVVWLCDEGNWCKVKSQNDAGYIARESVSKSGALPDLPKAFAAPCIVVYKAERILLLCDGQKVYAQYRVGLGSQPAGIKEREGDGKTPEGSYYVCTKNPNSKYHLALGVSYPNISDATRAFDAGIIDQSTNRSIQRAIGRRLCPPWNTALGGEIMIHGGGSQNDWTAGCIAVDNDVADVLYRMCPIGAKVEIYP